MHTTSVLRIFAICFFGAIATHASPVGMAALDEGGILGVERNAPAQPDNLLGNFGAHPPPANPTFQPHNPPQPLAAATTEAVHQPTEEPHEPTQEPPQPTSPPPQPTEHGVDITDIFKSLIL